jgi:hypothetical protein
MLSDGVPEENPWGPYDDTRFQFIPIPSRTSTPTKPIIVPPELIDQCKIYVWAVLQRNDTRELTYSLLELFTALDAATNWAEQNVKVNWRVEKKEVK